MKRLSISLLLTMVSTMSAQTIQVNKDNRTIAITATDEASATADVAEITVGFVTYGVDQDSTYAEGARLSNTIIKALHDGGISDPLIQSNRQGLTPLNDEDKVRYAKGIRYEFSQSWTVAVKAKQAAEVLHLAISAGANESGDVSWSYLDEEALQVQAAQKALERARRTADSMAAGLHAHLGPLVYASNQTPPRGLAALLDANGAALATMESRSAVISGRKEKGPIVLNPTKVTKSATVYAVFSLSE